MTDATMTPVGTPAGLVSRPTRPFYWSVRRELWEHRAVYIAPLIVAGLVLFGFALGVAHLPQLIAEIKRHHPGDDVGSGLSKGYNAVAGIIAFTSLIVAVSYCSGAMHGERRDRSLLFWKSLPVSDVTAVLAKLFVPMAVMPIVAVSIALVTQLIIMSVTSIFLASNGLSPALISNGPAIGHILVSLFYAAVMMSLWYAPIYGYLLLVSSWARRAPFLWALLPPFAIVVVEGIALHTHGMLSLIGLRLGGGFGGALSMSSGEDAGSYNLPHIEPLQFFTSPDLWGGLVVGAAFVAGAVYLRRRGEPI